MKKSVFTHRIALLLERDQKKEVARLLWPWFVQNDWTDLIWKNIEENRHLAIMGHGSASKTFTSAAWFLLDWWRNPRETAVIVTSDTVASMRRRIWSDLKTLKEKARVEMPGVIVDSKCMIQHSQHDEKHCIAGVAAESDNASSKIQGLHTKFIRVIFDEADNDFSRSIWSAISNLGTSGDLKVVALANPLNRSAEFGQHCEPSAGWHSINPDIDTEWKSRVGWKVLRLDGLKSPNISAGIDRFPFLLTHQGLQDIREKCGPLSREWWSQVRAWYPPEGTINSIFTSEILRKCDSDFQWYSSTTPIASCDPAFEGGDKCIMAIADMGSMALDPRKIGIKAKQFIHVQRKDTAKPVTMDFGDQIIAHCKANKVDPKNFIIDSTGTGLGISDYIRFAWGGDTVPVGFGGAPTELSISAEDSKKPVDRFDRFVSELWFVAREWCRMGLVHLIQPPRELRLELESRTYDLLVKDKIRIERKQDMKARGIASPDYADAFCLLIHLARIRSSFRPSHFEARQKVDVMKSFRRMAHDYQIDYGVKG